MKASIVNLRNKAKEILKALKSVSIHYHGKLKGTIVPAQAERKMRVEDHPFCGMRKHDKRSVKQVMKELRQPRHHAL